MMADGLHAAAPPRRRAARHRRRGAGRARRPPAGAAVRLRRARAARGRPRDLAPGRRPRGRRVLPAARRAARAATRYRVELDGTAPASTSTSSAPAASSAASPSAGRPTRCSRSPQGSDFLVEVDGAVHRISGGEAGLVRAPAPAMVVSIPVSAGDTVAEAGDVVAVVESMKLETALRAPVAGRVAGGPRRRQHAGRGRHQARPPRARRRRRPAAAPAAERVDLAALAPPAPTPTGPTRRRAPPTRSTLAALPRARVRRRRARRAPAARRASTAPATSWPRTTRPCWPARSTILRIFADLCALSRNRRGSRATASRRPARRGATRNPQEYLYAYLRSRDAGGRGAARVVPRQAAAGARALRRHRPRQHPGRRSARALYRMFLAHRRAAAHVPVVLRAAAVAPARTPTRCRRPATGEYQRTCSTSS